tara:strand:- start:965 stop:1498 length:534 start_codon:yes stop_codon:yes gene_type:complete
MENLNEIKNEITNLNERFFLILENFVPDYVSYLKNPKNPIPVNEIEHIKQTVNDINSQSFVLKNKMEVEIDNNEKVSNKLTDEIDKLQKENILLKKKRNSLEKTSLTAEGLFDDEIDWYKKQIKIIIVMIIGIIICIMFSQSLKLDFKQYAITIIGVIIIAIVFENIIMNIYNRIIN